MKISGISTRKKAIDNLFWAILKRLLYSFLELIILKCEK